MCGEMANELVADRKVSFTTEGRHSVIIVLFVFQITDPYGIGGSGDVGN